jgi:hypothetical protein
MTKRTDSEAFVRWWDALSGPARESLMSQWEGAVPPELADELWSGDNPFTTWGQAGDGPRRVYVRERWWPFIERRSQRRDAL